MKPKKSAGPKPKPSPNPVRIKKTRVEKVKSRKRKEKEKSLSVERVSEDVRPTSRKKQAPDLVCHICDVPFSGVGSLERHVNGVHLNLFRFPCPESECDCRFKDIRPLRSHMVQAHGRELPPNHKKCDDERFWKYGEQKTKDTSTTTTASENASENAQDLVTQNASAIAQEDSEETEGQPQHFSSEGVVESNLTDVAVTCQACDLRFSSFSKAKVHYASVHERNAQATSYQCKFCNFSSGFIPEIVSHAKSNHPDIGEDGKVQLLMKNVDLNGNDIENTFEVKDPYLATGTAQIETDSGQGEHQGNEEHRVEYDEPSKCDLGENSKNKRPKCLKCGRTFTNRTNFVIHAKSCHTSTAACSTADAADSLPLVAGSNVQSKPVPSLFYTCPICNLSFTDVIEIQQHVFNRHDVNWASRGDVLRRSVRSGELTPVEGAQSPAPPRHTCFICKLSFETEQGLEIHMYQCHEPLTCGVCLWSLCGHRSLRDHYAGAHHGVPLNPSKVLRSGGRNMSDLEEEIPQMPCVALKKPLAKIRRPDWSKECGEDDPMDFLELELSLHNGTMSQKGGAEEPPISYFAENSVLWGELT